MSDHIDQNHILRFDNFGFCLLCKKYISESINLSERSIVCVHLESEEHQSNCKALFESCFPDPSCESDDIRYVNILRNLAFDVSWEIGNEVTYICKKGNFLTCLLCEENISKTFVDKKKLELTLVSHLKSEFHLNKVKNKASWIYHPNDDTNYIAFHKFFVFCSYCQKYLKSPKNTLLQTAADHITTDVETIAKIKAREEQHDSVIEDLCLLFDFFNISDDLEDCNQQKSQLGDLETNIDCVHFPSQKVESTIDDRPICNGQKKEILNVERGSIPSPLLCKPSEKLSTRYDNTQQVHIIGVENVTGNSFLNTFNGVTLTNLTKNYSVVKLNEQYIELRENRFFCRMCRIFIQIDETGISLRKHLNREHNERLLKKASDFISKKLNQSTGNNNVNDTSKESDKFCLILTDIGQDKKFLSHLKFIKNNGKDFVCILCKDIITFSTCGKYVEMHFFQTDHLKKTYEIFVGKALAKKQADQHSSNVKNKKPKAQTDKKSLELFFNTNGIKLLPIKNAKKNNENISSKPDSQVVKRRLMKVLRLASEENLAIRINLQYLTIEDTYFFCTVCQSFISDCNSLALLNHCISSIHNQILIEHATNYLVSKSFKRECLKQAESDLILKQFYELVNKITENDLNDVYASHLLFITITNTCTNFSTGPSWIYCHLCGEPIEFTLCGIENHFLSNQHRETTYELNFRNSSKSSTKWKPSREQVSGFEVTETLNNRNHFKFEQSKSSTQISQIESKSSEFENAINKILKTSEPILQQVIERNRQYIELKNDKLSCIVCKLNIIPGKKMKISNLQSVVLHFNGKKHTKCKLLYENAISVENKCLPNPVPSNMDEASCSKCCESSSSDIALLKDTLHTISEKYREVKANKLFLSFKTKNFFCNLCEEVQTFSDRGGILRLHCLSVRHNEILMENALRFKLRLKDDLISSSEEDKKMLNKVLSVIRSREPFDVITSHAQFLSVKNKNFFCILCRKQLEIPTNVKSCIRHFLSYYHGVKVYALNCSSYSSTVKSEQNSLAQPDAPTLNLAAVTGSHIVEEFTADCATGRQINKGSSRRKTPNSQRRESFESSESNNKLLEIRKNLPDDLKAYGDKLTLSESTLYCKLCSFKCALEENLSVIPNTFQKHLSEHISYKFDFQIEQLMGMESFVSFSPTIQQCIKTNMNNLEMKGNVLFCCICQIKVCTKKGNHGKTWIGLDQMRDHFSSNRHRKNLAKYACQNV